MISQIHQTIGKRFFRQAIRLVPILALAACTHAGYAADNVQAGTQVVTITKSSYVPKEISIKPGTTVVWTNHDEMPHTVTSREHVFASKGLDTDDRFEHTFDREGDFTYYCTIHPFMNGVVHVHR